MVASPLGLPTSGRRRTTNGIEGFSRPPSEVLVMESNPDPTSYTDRLNARSPLIEINGKFTQVLLINDSDLAELFVGPGSGADYLVDAVQVVRDHLTHIEAFLREGILLTAATS
jgi:hypothetical protein